MQRLSSFAKASVASIFLMGLLMGGLIFNAFSTAASTPHVVDPDLIPWIDATTGAINVTKVYSGSFDGDNYYLGNQSLGFVQPATFTIDYNATSGMYRAWHGANSTLFDSSTNASAVINNAIGNNSNCGEILLRNGEYYLDVPIVLDYTRIGTHIVGEAVSDRLIKGVSIHPSAIFENGKYLIYVNQTGGSGNGGGAIKNLFLYNQLWTTKNVSGIMLCGSLFCEIIEDVYCQYLYNALHFYGMVWFTTVRNFVSSDANSAFVGDADLIMEIGAGLDDPIANRFDGFTVVHTGNMTNAVRLLNDSAYNEFYGLSVDGACYSESPLKITGVSNRIVNCRFQDVNTVSPTAVGTVYLTRLDGSNGSSNWISGYIPYYSSAHIKMDNGTFRNYIDFVPFGQSNWVVNATGAGIGNEIHILPPHQDPRPPDDSTITITHYGTSVKYTGYMIENSGTWTGTNGVAVAHGLAGTPTVVSIGVNAAQPYATGWTANATHIVITHNGLDSLTGSWSAEYKP